MCVVLFTLYARTPPEPYLKKKKSQEDSHKDPSLKHAGDELTPRPKKVGKIRVLSGRLPELHPSLTMYWEGPPGPLPRDFIHIFYSPFLENLQKSPCNSGY